MLLIYLSENYILELYRKIKLYTYQSINVTIFSTKFQEQQHKDIKLEHSDGKSSFKI